MDLPGRDRPLSVSRAFDKFNERLAASGAERGLRAAKKSDTEGDLYIYEVIGVDFWTGEGVKATDVAAKLGELKGVSRLNIYINSPGGDLFEGKTIYNLLSRFAAEKIVHVDGIAASAASLIAMAGNKIVTGPGATWLVHEVAQRGTTMGRGTAADHRHTAGELDVETRAICSIYEQRTRCPADKIAALMVDDRIISAAEAKSYGLTDEIGEVEQRQADEEAEAAKATAPRPVSPQTQAAAARALAKSLSEKFPGVRSGGSTASGPPGKPSTTHTPGNPGKGK